MVPAGAPWAPRCTSTAASDVRRGHPEWPAQDVARAPAVETSGALQPDLNHTGGQPAGLNIVRTGPEPEARGRPAIHLTSGRRPPGAGSLRLIMAFVNRWKVQPELEAVPPIRGSLIKAEWLLPV